VQELFHAVRKAQELLSTDTPTVCHGDTHIANTFTFLDAQGACQAGLFDFQLAIRGSCMHDVTYAILTSMDTADRQQHQESLLRFYLAELTEQLSHLRQSLQAMGHTETDRNFTPPTFDHIFLRYRQTAIWGLVIGWLICPPVNYGQPITDANIGRLARACVDLKTMDALGM
jgi:Ser/Thr protein kinase RdoA (MazF antagonist)